jgi:hypothetical protein
MSISGKIVWNHDSWKESGYTEAVDTVAHSLRTIGCGNGELAVSEF